MQRLHNGSRSRLGENQVDTMVIRQIRTVKRAPKHESKVQQVFLLEVAMEGEGGLDTYQYHARPRLWPP